MYEKGKEHRVSNKKCGSMDTGQVPDSIIRIEFYTKATNISVRINYSCADK
jgi:hypothetical protein